MQQQIDPIYGTVVPKPVEVVEKKFDLLVHHRDPGSGRVVGHNPYRLFCQGNKQFFERPVDSGNLYWADDAPAGRRVQHPETGKWNIIEGADHAAWISPEAKEAQRIQLLADKVAKVEDLEAKMIAMEQRALEAEAKNEAKSEEAAEAKQKVVTQEVKAVDTVIQKVATAKPKPATNKKAAPTTLEGLLK